MVDELSASPTDLEDVLLKAPFAPTLDGIELSYLVLDHLVARHELAQAFLVLHPDPLGPQVFVSGHLPVASDLAAELLSRPPGLYTIPDKLDPATRAAIAGTCNLALAAQAARSDGAVDAPSGLASLRVIEAALARDAARSARYGWPFVVVLLAVAGESTDDHWLALRRALHAALRIGDEAGVAGPGLALAILGNAGADVARPFAARVGAALGAAGTGEVELLVATARAPDETVDPGELWRLVVERLDELSGHPAAGGPAHGTVPSQLELELRSLPGVVSVGTGAPTADGQPQLTVVAVDPAPSLHDEIAKRLGKQFAQMVVHVEPVSAETGEGPEAGETERRSRLSLYLEPSTPSPSVPVPDDRGGAGGSYLQYGSIAAGTTPAYRPAPDPGEPSNGLRRVEERSSGVPRVNLLVARFDPESGMSEVDLAFGNARATGRASVGPMVGGAQATLLALGGLGIDVPYYLVSAERAPGVKGEAVVVVLAPRRPSEGGFADSGEPSVERIGVANGTEPVEAASRATLSALNRFLASWRKASED